MIRFHLLLPLLLLTAAANAAPPVIPLYPWANQNDPEVAKRAYEKAPPNSTALTPAQAAALQAEQERQQQQQNQNQNQNQQNPMMQQLPQMMQGLMGVGGGPSAGMRPMSGEEYTGPNLGLGNCEGQTPDTTALQTMLECAGQKFTSGALNEQAALVDVDNKIMFIINRNEKDPAKQVLGCVAISTGKNGTGSGYGQTPRGMMFTGSHHPDGGGKYSSAHTGQIDDAVGLKGTDAETKVRSDNGVVMHRAHGRAGNDSTLGCIGVEDARFNEVKKVLYGSDSEPKKSAIFIFDKSSRETCSGPSAGSGGSSRQEQGSSGAYK